MFQLVFVQVIQLVVLVVILAVILVVTVNAHLIIKQIVRRFTHLVLTLFVLTPEEELIS